MKTPETTIIATPTGTGTSTTDGQDQKKEKPLFGTGTGIKSRPEDLAEAKPKKEQASGSDEKGQTPENKPQTGSDEKKPNDVVPPNAGKEPAPMSDPQTGSGEKNSNDVVPPNAGNEIKDATLPDKKTKPKYRRDKSNYSISTMPPDNNPKFPQPLKLEYHDEVLVVDVTPRSESNGQTTLPTEYKEPDPNQFDDEADFDVHMELIENDPRYKRQLIKDLVKYVWKNIINLGFSFLQSWPYIFFGAIRGLEKLGIKNPVLFAYHDSKEWGMMSLYGGPSFAFNFVINYQSNQKLRDRIIDKIDKIKDSENGGLEVLKLSLALIFAAIATLPGYALSTESFDDFTLLPDWGQIACNGIFCSSVLTTRTLAWLDLFDTLNLPKIRELIASQSTLNWLWLGTATALFAGPIAYPFYFKSYEGAEEIEKFKKLNLALATISTMSSEIFYIKHLALLPERVAAYINNNRFGKCLASTAAFATALACFPSGATWVVAAGAAYTFVTNPKTLFYLDYGSQLAAGLVNWSMWCDQFSWKLTKKPTPRVKEMHNPTGPDQPRSLPSTPAPEQLNPRLSVTRASNSKSQSWFSSFFYRASNDAQPPSSSSSNTTRLLSDSGAYQGPQVEEKKYSPS